MSRALRLSRATVCCLLMGTAAADEFRVQTRSDPLGQPDGGSVGAQFQSSFSLQAGDADGKATLNLSRLSKIPTEGKYFRYQLKISAPLDTKKQDQVDIGTLANITAGTNVGLEWSYVDWRQPQEKKTAALLAVCENAVPNLIPGYTLALMARAEYNMGCTIAGLSSKDNLLAATKAINGARKVCEKEIPKTQKCKELLEPVSDAALAKNVDSVISALNPMLVEATNDAVTAIGVWTVGVSGNKQAFEYVLPDAPSDVIKQRENGWAVSFAYTRLYRDNLWSIGYSHEEAYKGGTKADVCTPLGTTGALRCLERTIGAPVKKTSELLFGEYRYLIADKYAVSPRIEYDIEESEWGLRVPIYFVSNTKSQLTAGIVLGWDEENSSGAAVFVGKPFKFLD